MLEVTIYFKSIIPLIIDRESNHLNALKIKIQKLCSIKKCFKILSKVNIWKVQTYIFYEQKIYADICHEIPRQFL